MVFQSVPRRRDVRRVDFQRLCPGDQRISLWTAPLRPNRGGRESNSKQKNQRPSHNVLQRCFESTRFPQLATPPAVWCPHWSRMEKLLGGHHSIFLEHHAVLHH